MTEQQTIILRKTPFWFIKWLCIIELLFAVVPFILAFVLRLWEHYNSTAAAGKISYGLLMALAFAFLQVVIVTLSFVTWYVPSYQIDPHRIVHRRANLFEDRWLIDTQSIEDVQVRRSPLAKRFGYGTLVLTGGNDTTPAYISDISTPNVYAELIQDMIEPPSTSIPRPALHSVADMIANGENQFVEFKSSLMWDYRQQCVNKALYEPVMKNITAFLNSSGGTLLIGVSDAGEVLGLEPDYQSIKKPNADGFENVFSQAFNAMVGVEFRRFLELTFPQIDGKQVCVIAVNPSSEPAYLSYQGQEAFYIRAGNATQPLSVSKATHYIRSHFASH